MQRVIMSAYFFFFWIRAGHFATISVSYPEAAMAQADDWSWDRYRPLLKLQVRQLELDPRLQRRFDSSDLVQDALFEAISNLDQYRGRTEEERVAWLRKICRNKAMDKYREETARKGDVRR